MEDLDFKSLQFYKHRDEDGAIHSLKTTTSNEIILESRQWENFVVIDDICDGGTTFIELAKILPKAKLYLFTTYGIYSKGMDVLLDAGYVGVQCKYVVPCTVRTIENNPYEPTEA
jgi:phosphoribosylpyrophosphate synthetase